LKSLTFKKGLISMKQSNFHIINASAGSGKTYTLVLYYLIELLGSKNSRPYRQMLALTFTNKAVNEMKARILEALKDLSKNSDKGIFLQQQLCDALGIEKTILIDRAEKMLRKIIFEYGSFDIITLDKFTHRIVRTFAKEFELPQGFEVVLDSKNILDKVVRSVIDQVGQDDFITQLLLKLSLSKVSQGLSWDVQTDLDDFAALLLNENDRIPLADLRLKDRKTHHEDQEKLKKELKNTKDRIAVITAGFFKLLNDNGLEREDFMRQMLHKHLEQIQSGKYDKLYENQLEGMLKGEQALYKKTTEGFKINLIEELRPQLTEQFLAIKKEVGFFFLLDKTLKYWTPRLVFQQIESSLEALQNEMEIRLLGEFNRKISTLVQAEQAPYIFARLGERYQHYFLDEFQDTSSLQWANLIPLIGNALEGESLDGTQGSLVLVGDPKQAIYRWRGGDIQQFVSLLNKKSKPFQVDPWIKRLEMNFRSAAAIVSFNNAFFFHIAHAFNTPEIQSIYGADSQQELNHPDGYVQIKALPKGGNQLDKIPQYVTETILAVEQAIELQYGEKDIAVLVRTKSQSVLIGAELIAKGYKIVSSDSLEVSKSSQVQALVAFLNLFDCPNQVVHHKIILDLLWDSLEVKKKQYFEFINETVHYSTSDFIKIINQQFSLSFSWSKVIGLPLAEKVDYVVESFPCINSNDIFVSSFMEDVFEFSRGGNSTLSAYLKHWELQSEKLRLATPENMNAIRVMTIHQAKGLEFPVVILPFMDTPIYPNVKEKIWYSFQGSILEDVQWGWFNFSKKLPLYSAQAEALYQEHLLAKQLDALNVLYVALTRAKNQLYIVTQEVNEVNSLQNYAQLFSSFVRDQGKVLEENIPFELGSKLPKKNIKEVALEYPKIMLQVGMSSKWKNNLIIPSIKSQEILSAQERGLLLHELLAKISNTEDVAIVLEDESYSKLLPKPIFSEIKNTLNQLIIHPELEVLFDGKDRVFCEKEVLIPDGTTLRPDRINISKEGKVIIVDYKTGKPKLEDKKQIDGYAEVMHKLGYNSIETKLVYIDQKIEVITEINKT